MRFKRPVNILSSLELTPAVQRNSLVAAVAVAAATLSLGSFPVVADEPDADETHAVAPAANADTAEMSARERRREERRRNREASAPAEEAAATSEADAPDPNAPLVFVVAVQPEMECRRVVVVGSRVPKEVCTPVGLREAEEEQAQEFLRRTRERSTLAVPCGAPNPALPGPAASVC